MSGDGSAIVGLEDSHVRSRHLNAPPKVLEANVNGNVVMLNGNEGERVTSGNGVPERKGNVKDTILSGFLNELLEGGPLSDHFSKTLSSLSRKLLPHEEVVVVKGIDSLTTDDDSGLLDKELTDSVGPVSPDTSGFSALSSSEFTSSVLSDSGATLEGSGARNGVSTILTSIANALGVRINVGTTSAHGTVDTSLLLNTSDTRELNDAIHKVNKITSPIQSALGILTESNLGRERLFKRLNSEIGVLVVPITPQSEFSIESKIHISSTCGHHLSTSNTRTVAI